MKKFIILFLCGVLLDTSISSVVEIVWSHVQGHKICRSGDSLLSVEKEDISNETLDQTLTISDAKITRIFPLTFRNLNIQSLILDFAHTQLGLEPESFSGLPLLKTLWFSSGIICLNEDFFYYVPNLISLLFKTNGTQQSLREGLSQLRKLESLTIVDSYLGKIDENTFFNYPSTISYLELSGTKITEITMEGFFPLKNLKHLVLHSNNLTELNFGTFRHLIHLKVLKVVSNRLTSIDRIFRGPNELETLDLRDNKISIIDSDAFFDLKISKLLLGYNNFETLKQGTFGWLPTLEELNLDFNHIKNIERGVFRGFNISLLSLRNNNLSRIDDGAFQYLSGNLLDLSGNENINITKVSTLKSSIRGVRLSQGDYLCVNGNHWKV